MEKETWSWQEFDRDQFCLDPWPIICLKSLKILYQKALCVESMIQNGPKGEKVSRQESYKDLLWSTAFTFFQKQWILKNTMWVKYWPDWSKARKKICSRQRCTKRFTMTFTSHQNICLKAKTVNLLPVTQRSASEQWIFNFKLCKILAYDIASTSNI